MMSDSLGHHSFSRPLPLRQNEEKPGKHVAGSPVHPHPMAGDNDLVEPVRGLGADKILAGQPGPPQQ